MKVESITIYSRGKNRDVYGNPYHAFKAVVETSRRSYFRDIIIIMPMSYGNSGERDCLMWAVTGINEALGLKLKINDKRITHYYKHVSRDSDLMHPENWK